MSLKGWEGAIRVGATISAAEDGGSDEIAVQSVATSFGNAVEALFKLGSREPQELKEGNIDITLDITAHYQHATPTTWSARAGVGSVGALTEYYVGIYPEGATATNPEIRLLGKFGDWSLDISQDGVAIESVSFVGKVVAVGAAFIGS